MPSIKHKTHKGIKKRFKVTATGKVIHKRSGSSHLNSHKSGKQIRRLRKKAVVQMRAVNQRLRIAVGKEFVLPSEELETEPETDTGSEPTAAPAPTTTETPQA